MKKSRTILTRLKENLIDSAQESIPPEAWAGRGWETMPFALHTGVVPPGKKEAVFAKKEILYAGSTGKKGPAVLVICPIKIETPTEVHYPFLIPALLNSKGYLIPPENKAPRIPRRYLAPVVTKKGILLGEAEKSETFLEKIEKIPADWKEYWQLCMEYFEAVTGRILENFKLGECSVTLKGYLLLEDPEGGPWEPVVRLYNDLVKSKKSTPLLNNLLSIESPEESPPALPFEECSRGRMDKNTPLSSEIKQAFTRIQKLNDGEFITLEAPEGTDKETLLKTIAASLIIRRALEEGKPPLIVITSPERWNQKKWNKAFTLPGNSLLTASWLPPSREASFALFGKNKKEETTLCYTIVGSEKIKKIEITEEFFKKGLLCFMEKWENFMGEKPGSLKEAVAGLHKKLKDSTSGIDAGKALLNEKENARKALELHTPHEKLPEFSLKTAQTIEKNRTGHEKISCVKAALQEKMGSPSFFSKLFGFLGFVKKRKARRCEKILSGLSGQPDKNIDYSDIPGVEAYLNRLLEQNNTEYNKLNSIKEVLDQFTEKEKQWEQWKQKSGLKTEQENSSSAIEKLLEERSFYLALHYWEGRKLREEEKLLASKRKTTGSKEDWSKFLLSAAMETPCFTVEFTNLPDALCYSAKEDKPLLNFIDLLIIEEAQGLSLSSASPIFGAARKALLIGTPFINKEVAKHNFFNLQKEPEQTDREKNLFSFAEKLLAHKNSKEQPLILMEQLTSAPGIVRMINHLTEKKRLIPRKEPVAAPIQPTTGWGHISGWTEKALSGRRNPEEAKKIALWLSRQKTVIENFYGGLPLKETVLILTPFKAQRRQLTEALETAGLEDMKVQSLYHSGRAHKIVIYSPVYTYREQEEIHRFPVSRSILAGALLRALDSFLIFGDTACFAPDSSTPYGILGEYILQKKPNEIPGIQNIKRESLPEKAHITDPQRHQKALEHIFKKAEKRIIIASPIIDESAVAEKQIDRIIQKAVRREVSVTVYTASQTDKSPLELLSKAGAAVKIIGGIGSRLLAMDDTMLLEGTFNWLSKNAPLPIWQKEESFCYTAPGAAEYIREVITDMEERKVKNYN